MVLVTSNSRVEYPGNNSVGPWAFLFKIYAASDLQVTVLDSTTGLETTLSYPADFSVTGVGNGAGGTVTTTDVVASTESITIRRVRPLTQLVNLTNQGPFLPGNYEDALDKLMMVSQQLDVDGERSVKLAETTDPTTFDATLPANMAAGDAIVVNATANGFSMGSLSSAQLSAWNATANLQLDTYTSAGGQFTPGVTTQLTTSSAPGNLDNLTITQRVSGTVKVLEHDEYSLSGTTVTFTSAIPAGCTRVEIGYMLVYQINTVLPQNIPWNQLGTGASTRNVRDKLREIVTPYDFGAVGDGTTDDTTAYTNAIARAHTLGGTVAHPAGTFKLTDNVTANSNVTLDYSGGGIITIATGKVLTNSGHLVAPRNKYFTGLGTYVFTKTVKEFYPEWWGALGDDSNDDSTAINAANVAINASGGGVLSLGAAIYKLSSDVTQTSKVSVQGAGPNVTSIHGSGSINWKLTGGANGWGGPFFRDCTFNGVVLKLGTLVADECEGTEVVDCVFKSATQGIYFGFNCFFTNVVRCKFVDCTTGCTVDFTTGGATSGAMMRFTDCEFHDSAATGLAHTGIALSGAPTGGASIFIDRCEFQALTVAGLNITSGNNRELVTMRDSHFELMGAAAFFVINDGALVTVDGLWSFSATEAAWFKSSGGITTLEAATGNWTASKFAKITGGIIKVDQDRVYSPSKFWGNDQQIMWVAGSTNAGKILSLPSRARGWTSLTTGSLNDGAPNATPIAVTQAGDKNNRVYTCCVDTTGAVGTDNSVRFQFSDGFSSFNCDLAMPLFVGKATITIVWIRGTSARAYGIFSGTAPGATTTKGLDSGAVSDNTDFGNATFLNISTIKAGATCATMTISSLTEEIQSLYVADT